MSGDDRWAPYDPGPGAGEPTVAEPLVDTGRSTAASAVPLLLLVVPLVVVAGGAVWLFGSSDDAGDGAGSDPRPPDALSAEGLDELRTDLRERTGATEVFRAVVYPGYAVVAVPVDATSQREQSYYWDGDLDDGGSKGTATQARTDLADVDAHVVGNAVTRAKRLVEDATTWYVVVAGPGTTAGADDRGTTVTAYASNDFSESASVELALDGTVVARYVSTEQ